MASVGTVAEQSDRERAELLLGTQQNLLKEIRWIRMILQEALDSTLNEQDMADA